MMYLILLASVFPGVFRAAQRLISITDGAAVMGTPGLGKHLVMHGYSPILTGILLFQITINMRILAMQLIHFQEAISSFHLLILSPKIRQFQQAAVFV